MAENKDFIVDGFIFSTQDDADLARNEKKRIERIEEKIDYNNAQMVNAVLKKAINNRVFKTPVGYEFLRKLQKAVELNLPDGESAPDVPVFEVYNLRDSVASVVEKVKPSKKKSAKPAKKEFFSRRTSIIINVVLLVLVCVMFYITINGSNPNILNYEKAIQNRYVEWDKELSDREAVIREKEKELLINE